jgi:hypothetical protein
MEARLQWYLVQELRCKVFALVLQCTMAPELRDVREASGKLIDMDETDGIVNLEQGSRMIPMTYLCKGKQS